MDAQEKLLQKLNEYGDNFLDTYEVKNKKKKNKNKQATEDPINTESLDANLDNSIVENTVEKITKKKKRKKKKKSDSKHDTKFNSKLKHNAGGAERHIEQIKKELGLEDFKEEQERKMLEEERKKKQLEKLENKTHQPEIVVFHSRRVKQLDEEQNSKDYVEADKKDGVVNELDLEAARYDVRKFGISGSKGEQKEEAMKDLLLRLGAKPPKNKFYNYKEYQELKKKQREDYLEQKSWDKTVGNQVKGNGKGSKRKRDRNDIGVVDGQVGKFKSGVLFLKKKDIHSVKKAKAKR